MKDNLLTKIAINLGELHRRRAEARILDRRFKNQKENRIVEITPKCWPGSNETERKCSMVLALASDETLASIDEELGNLSDELERISAEIHVLEAERDAIQWTIRDGFLPSPFLVEMADQAIESSMDDDIERLR